MLDRAITPAHVETSRAAAVGVASLVSSHELASLRAHPHKGSGSWWSQPGSNRRPPACKAGALPAELWPLVHWPKSPAAISADISFGSAGERRGFRRLRLWPRRTSLRKPPAKSGARHPTVFITSAAEHFVVPLLQGILPAAQTGKSSDPGGSGRSCTSDLTLIRGAL
jgi:hypothetical protein